MTATDLITDTRERTSYEDGRSLSQEPPITFRGKDIKRHILRRLNFPHRLPGTVAKRDLERYYEIVDHVVVPFSEADWAVIRAALGGYEPEVERIRLLWADVADYCRRHNVQSDLAQRMRQMPIEQLITMLDMLARELVRPPSTD